MPTSRTSTYKRLLQERPTCIESPLKSPCKTKRLSSSHAEAVRDHTRRCVRLAMVLYWCHRSKNGNANRRLETVKYLGLRLYNKTALFRPSKSSKDRSYVLNIADEVDNKMNFGVFDIRLCSKFSSTAQQIHGNE